MLPITDANFNYEPDHTKDSADEVDVGTRVNPMDLVYDQLLSTNGRGMLYMPFFNFSNGDVSMTHEFSQHEQARNGLSDNGAHCGAICDGGMPTFLMTNSVRDSQRGPRLPLKK